uniref:Uncharacterized protein n=1 Tax=Caenorhabditis japonica TaxID=281687 RepID=A0A8R1HXC7_CAEJA
MDITNLLPPLQRAILNSEFLFSLLKNVPLASSSEPKLGEIDCASSSRPSSETAIRQQTPTTIDASKVEVPEYDSEDDYDEENTALTLGTANIPAKQFLNQLEKKTIERFKMAKGMLDNVQSALCVVVQIIPGGALMFTVKNGVRNVLVLESGCEGLEGPLRLGDVAFFEISMRRTETRDDLLPTAIYSHVAVRRKPTTPLTETKINTFKNSIRTFGGLIEMKVKIRLTERGSVQHFYDDDQTFTKTESERKIFFLTSTNGLLVTIPNERIIELLDENLMAKFDLVAWAVHRKAVGNVCLHIGKDGEAWQKFVDGKLRELPTLSNNYHMNR